MIDEEKNDIRKTIEQTMRKYGNTPKYRIQKDKGQQLHKQEYNVQI